MTAMTLAIVDDNTAMIEIVVEIAEGLGLQAEGYASGEAFLDGLTGSGPDILLLDLQMPGLDGMELLSRLAKLGLKSAVYIVSGTDGPVRDAARYLGEAGSLDMRGAVAKPVRVAELRDVLSRAMGTSSPA
jgi:FixJ family two-component response regulator